MKCSKTSWYTAVLTLDLRKHSGPTPADDMAPQTITDCGNFTLDLKQRGFCASPLFLQILGPWFPKEMLNLLSSENITLDHSAAVQSFLSLAQARRFWRCLLFKSGLTQGMRQLKPMSCIRLCVVVLEALTPAAVHSLWISPTFLNGFCFTILSRVWLSLLLVHLFLPNLFLPFASLLMCLDTELCEQPANDLLCLALLVQGVNDRLLDNCQVKSNQIKSLIVTSPQHKCLGEWNSYERAPDSAKNKNKKKKTGYIWTVHIYRLYRRQCAKYTYIYSVHIVYYKDIINYNYNYQLHIIHRMCTSTLCTLSIHYVVYT